MHENQIHHWSQVVGLLCLIRLTLVKVSENEAKRSLQQSIECRLMTNDHEAGTLGSVTMISHL